MDIRVHEILSPAQPLYAGRQDAKIASFEFFVRKVGEIVQPQPVRCLLLHIVRVYVPQIILEDRETVMHFQNALVRFLVLVQPRFEQVEKLLFRIQILGRITDDGMIQTSFHSDRRVEKELLQATAVEGKTFQPFYTKLKSSHFELSLYLNSNKTP